jgi:hypothetical protein
MPNNRTNPSGAVVGVSGWSQSGTLVAGEFLAPGQSGPGPTGWALRSPQHILNMQVNFDDESAAVRTVQFGITPAVTQAVSAPQPQPTGTPPNPPIVDQNGIISPASVTNGSPVILFPPPSANPVIAGNPQVLPVNGDYLQLAGDPTRVYQVQSSAAPSTVTLKTPYRGTSTLRTSVSRLASAPIPPPGPPAALMPASIDTVAIISWTVQGNKVTRIVTIGNGTSISAPAEAVNIVVLDNTYNLVSAGGSPSGSGVGFQYTVNVQVTTGVRAAILPPFLNWTYPPDSVALVGATPSDYQPFEILAAASGAGLEVTVPVPPNAGVIAFTIAAVDSTHPANAPVMVVSQLDAGGGFLSSTFLGPPDPTEFIPLVPNAASVVVESPGADTQDFSIVWVIDG